MFYMEFRHETSLCSFENLMPTTKRIKTCFFINGEPKDGKEVIKNHNMLTLDEKTQNQEGDRV